MKRLFAAAIAVGAVGVSSAAAADVSSAAADSFYVGVHGGFANLSTDWETEQCCDPNLTGSESGTGLLGGVQAGYIHNFDQFALGVEGDLSFTDASAGFDGYEGIGIDLDFLASIRARAGWNIDDNVMPFLTAGVAFGDFQYNQEGDGFGAPTDSVSDSRVGFVVGGGVDVGFAEAWTGRVEVLYYDFGNASGSFGGLFPYDYDIDADVTVVRAGISYNFGM
jgi:outer membrane immunogenic protein